MIMPGGESTGRGSIGAGGERLSRPVGPLLEVVDASIVCEVHNPQIEVLLTHGIAVPDQDPHDGRCFLYGDRYRFHGEGLALVLEPECLDRLMADLGLLVR